MKLYNILFALLTFSQVHSQEIDSVRKISTLFEFQLDSVEERITEYKWGKDTSHYIYYTVKNISEDTLEYITNSCFYYNHYFIKIENSEYDLNPWGGCYCNVITPHKLAPENTFSKCESIFTFGSIELMIGARDVTLTIPLVKDNSQKYRVDGRSFVENSENLIFSGKTKVIRNTIDCRSRKKRKKQQNNLDF